MPIGATKTYAHSKSSSAFNLATLSSKKSHVCGCHSRYRSGVTSFFFIPTHVKWICTLLQIAVESEIGVHACLKSVICTLCIQVEGTVIKGFLCDEQPANKKTDVKKSVRQIGAGRMGHFLRGEWPWFSIGALIIRCQCLDHKVTLVIG